MLSFLNFLGYASANKGCPYEKLRLISVAHNSGPRHWSLYADKPLLWDREISSQDPTAPPSPITPGILEPHPPPQITPGIYTASPSPNHQVQAQPEIYLHLI